MQWHDSSPNTGIPGAGKYGLPSCVLEVLAGFAQHDRSAGNASFSEQQQENIPKNPDSQVHAASRASNPDCPSKRLSNNAIAGMFFIIGIVLITPFRTWTQ